MLPTIALSFPHGAEPAFTFPGVDPRAAVIPIPRLVIDLPAAAADIALDRAAIRASVGGRVGTAFTATLLSPFSGRLEGAGPDPSLGCVSSLLGSDVGLGVLAIGHSPAPLHEFIVQAHGADKALSDGATVSVYISLLTPHRLLSDQIIRRGGLLAAPVILAAALAKLTALGASMLRSRILVPRISSVSPSTTVAVPVMSAKAAVGIAAMSKRPATINLLINVHPLNACI
jgi:hypothetical protein